MIITINDSEYNKLYEAGNLDREAIIDTIVKAGGTEKVKIKVDYRQNNPCDILIWLSVNVVYYSIVYYLSDHAAGIAKLLSIDCSGSTHSTKGN